MLSRVLCLSNSTLFDLYRLQVGQSRDLTYEVFCRFSEVIRFFIECWLTFQCCMSTYLKITVPQHVQLKSVMMSPTFQLSKILFSQSLLSFHKLYIKLQAFFVFFLPMAFSSLWELEFSQTSPQNRLNTSLLLFELVLFLFKTWSGTH